MFFMVTYGSLCLISFLNHFGSSPAYRPSFKSKWYLSLLGFIVAVWVMFKISAPYALTAIAVMTGLNIYINSYHSKRKGLVSIFANTIFQVNRNLQVYLQKRGNQKTFSEWRPSVICISKDSFVRNHALKLLSWISYKYGFGTYLHRIEGYYSKSTCQKAREELKSLLKHVERNNYVYIDTLISPSYTTAVAQSIQIPGIAGMENNMILLEYNRENPEELPAIVDNFNLVHAGDFDVCILGSSNKPAYYKNGMHLWIKSSDTENTNLMILLSFIILGHPDWRKSNIRIFHICKKEDVESTRLRMGELIQSGRLPITFKNIEIVVQEENVSSKKIINSYSSGAALTILGFREETINHNKESMFTGYDELGNILFVNSCDQKIIE